MPENDAIKNDAIKNDAIKEAIDLQEKLNGLIKDAAQGWNDGDAALQKQLGAHRKIVKEAQESAEKGDYSVDSLRSMTSLLNEAADGNKDINQWMNKRNSIEEDIIKAKKKGNKQGVEDLNVEKKVADEQIAYLNAQRAREARAKALNKLTFGLYGKIKEAKKAWKEMDSSTKRKVVAWGMLTGLIGAVVVAFSMLKKLAFGFATAIDELGETFGVAGVRSGQLQSNLLEGRENAVALGKGLGDVTSVMNTLTSEFGLSAIASSRMADNILDSAMAMGLSTDEGAKLFGTLMSIGNMSQEQAERLAESTYNLAEANDVAPQAVMKDIAENTEVFAKFSKDSGKNIMKTAIQAKKLGISLGDVAGIAEGLLDVESSLTAEMEASMMIGRQINFSRARQLALEGDMSGMMNEVLDQLGGEAEWNELNILQRQSMAKALGTDVATMGKLVGEQANLADAAGDTEMDLKAKDSMSALTSLGNEIKKIGLSIQQSIGGSITEVVKSFKTWLEDAGGIEKIQALAKKFGDTIAGWITKFQTLFDEQEDGTTKMDTWWNNIMKVLTNLPSILVDITVAFAGIKLAIWAINFAMASNPVFAIIMGVLALGAAIFLIAKHWDFVKAKLKQFFSYLWGRLKMIPQIIFDSFTKPFEDGFSAITDLFSGEIGILEAFKRIGGAIFDLFTTKFRMIMNLIGNLFGVENLGELIIQPIKDLFGTVVDWIADKFTNLKDRIGEIFSGLGPMLSGMIKAPFNLLISGMNSAIGLINSMNITVPDWVYGIGGQSWGMNITPIPHLQTGGEVKETGLAVVHKGEVFSGEGGLNIAPVVGAISELKTEMVQLRTEMNSYLGAGGITSRQIGRHTVSGFQEAILGS